MKLFLMGAFQAFGPGDAEVDFRSDSERALLAYLAVEPALTAAGAP
ncbi:MAG TPA: hypothetical protein VMN57_01225 [Anaerolineales bacterium]|nr:hypothetical protein [Anaerolineales bacterium]